MKKQFAVYLVAAMIGILTLSVPAASALEIPALHLQAQEMAKRYSDTVGWVKVSGTEIDEVVVQSVNDPFYYLRRDYNGDMSFDGSYFADYRCVFTGESATPNTVIYGNSFAENGDKRFDQLKRYKDPAFAKENPYILFATLDQTSVYEVFAVSVIDISVPYNIPSLNEDERLDAVRQVRNKSLFPFDHIAVSEKSKLLTLVTSDYSNGTDYRFVVMAALVENTDLLPNNNENPLTGR